jgi:uncharacterized membrane protein (Fun14 family)
MDGKKVGGLLIALKNVFGVVARPGTYGNLLYLLLSFPLGLAYFVLLTTGISLGIGLYLIVVGLPLLVMVLMLWRQMVKLERLQAKWLLGQETRPEPILRWAGAKRAWPWFRARLSSSLTWRGLGFLFLKFPLGLVAFVLLVVMLTVSAALVALPFLHQHGLVQVDDLSLVMIEGPWQSAGIVLSGLLLLVLSFHLFNGYARVFRWLSGKLICA